MFRQLGADHHVPFKCLGTNLEFFHKLRPNLLFADIWAKLWKRLRQLLGEHPCCPTACAIGAHRVVLAFIHLNKDLRGGTNTRFSHGQEKKSRHKEEFYFILFYF